MANLMHCCSARLTTKLAAHHSLSSWRIGLHGHSTSTSTSIGRGVEGDGSLVLPSQSKKKKQKQKKGALLVACSGQGLKSLYGMDLNEYMLSLERPLGIQFAQSLDGTIYIAALAHKGNAEKSQLIMVGDVLKKVSAVSGDEMWEVEDFNRLMFAIRNRKGAVNLVLERPTSSVHIQALMSRITDGPFNRGRVAIATWNDTILSSNILHEEDTKEGHIGFSIFSSKFLQPKGLQSLAKSKHQGKSEFGEDGIKGTLTTSNGHGPWKPTTEMQNEVIASFSDEESHEGIEWTHGNFSLEEYVGALERSQTDLCYDHTLGMQYTKIKEHIYVGSCIQTQNDVHKLANDIGISAILNLQRKTEQANWGIDGDAIDKAFNDRGLVVVNCPIREVDSVDLRRKLPFAVGVLYRLLRKGHRVFVTCTTGLDRSPACIIAYFHWIQDVALQEAVEILTNRHPCGVDRAAIVWATWDLIALVEDGNHEGPPTHAVQFVWNHGCREGEEVLVVGDFRGWNEPLKAVHSGGPKYTVDLRLPQGKYYYKFIVGGQWRHSHSLPTEGDTGGNTNNVLRIGDRATTRFDSPFCVNTKDLTNIKVIERPLTDDERFTLAFAARRLAFSISPVRFAPKN